MIKLFIVEKINVSKEDFADYVERLPFGEAEKKRLLNIKNHEYATSSLSAYSALAKMLAEKDPAQLTVKRNPYEKPYFCDIPLPFSISHSASLAAITVGNEHGEEIGVDIEFERDKLSIESLTNRFFTQNEKRIIEHSDQPQRDFFRIWTAKEAFSKALGTPLALNIKQDISAEHLQQFELIYNGRHAYLSVYCNTPYFNKQTITILRNCKELEIYGSHEIQN